MTFPAYPKYKNSGVEWLGKVPTDWSIVPIKHASSIVGGTTPKSDTDAYWDGEFVWITPADLSKLNGTEIFDSQRKISQVGLDSCGLTLVPPKSIVLSTRAPIGSLGIASVELATNQGCKSLIPKSNIISKFLFFVLSISTEELNVRGRGTTFLELSADELGVFRVPVPNLEIQHSIANFLDHETAKIDALIAEQEKLIELLNEKRQSIISTAVCRGLDPNAPMKDSGVEWLGMVPEHWSVKAFKHIVSIPITDGPHETPQFIDEGVPFVSAEAVSNGVVDFAKIRGFISRESHEKYSLKYTPKRGDIFMVKSGATTGVCAIVETDDEFNIWSPLAVVRCMEGIEPYFVLNYMRSPNFQEAIALNWNFGTQQNIGMGVIENLMLPVPPLHEQIEISKRLGEFIEESNALIFEATKGITLLKERRSALISAAVCGQIDVRNFHGN